MIFTPRIKSAIRFSIETHEVNQKQKRKGKDIPYITHPLSVGIILARAGASEDAIMAGILHDTIEDSIEKLKVTQASIAERFGQHVAELVESVTEMANEPSWDRRKREAIGRIARFSHESLLVKSADLISNGSDIVDDYAAEGEVMFARFHAPRNDFLKYYLDAIAEVLKHWPENPLAEDLRELLKDLRAI